MLTFFPTPYPDELWYSMMCRYQVRSGDTNSLLMGNRIDSHLFLPDSGIYETVKLLPENIFNVKKIILDNTLFPYFFRMFSVEEKNEMLSRLSVGIPANPKWKSREKKLKTMLRYCPICKQEEQQQYGESYWHREHQLPLMTICPKHHCRLVEFVGDGFWKVNVFLPDFLDEDIKPNFQIEPYERLLSDMLYRYLTAPIEMGPTNGYSNLQYELKRKYQNILKGHIFMLDTNRLYADLVELFGVDVLKTYFGKQIRNTLPMQLHKWRFHAPEFYILLAVLLKQEPEITFGAPLDINMLGKRIYEVKDVQIEKSKEKSA